MHKRYRNLPQEEPTAIATMSNNLIDSRYKLTVWEHRLILWMISKINPYDEKKFLRVSIRLEEIQTFMKGMDDDSKEVNVYKRMESIISRLQSRIIDVKKPMEDNRVTFNWFHHVRYQEGKGEIELEFHEYLNPYLLDLRRNYSELKIEEAFKLRSRYSIRFYERLQSMVRTERRAITFPNAWHSTLQDLRHWLSIRETEYKKFFDFKRFVIEMACEELDRVADLSFDFEPVKEGKKVVACWFYGRKAKKPATSADDVLVAENPAEETRPFAEMFLQLPPEERKALRVNWGSDCPKDGDLFCHKMSDEDFSKSALFFTNFSKWWRKKMVMKPVADPVAVSV